MINIHYPDPLEINSTGWEEGSSEIVAADVATEAANYAAKQIIRWLRDGDNYPNPKLHDSGIVIADILLSQLKFMGYKE